MLTCLETCGADGAAPSFMAVPAGAAAGGTAGVAAFASGGVAVTADTACILSFPEPVAAGAAFVFCLLSEAG